MYDKRLDTFIAVADCGSFTKAAEQLFISAPAVMNQVNQLEKQLGVHLIERTPRGITQTEAGKTFYLEAKKIIRASQDSIERVKRAAEADRFTIRIGSSLLCPYKPIMDIWQRGGDECSKFKISIVPFQDDREAFTTLLSNLGDEIDVIGAACSSDKWESRCNFYSIGKKPVTVSVPRDHRLTKKQALDIEDLYGERLLIIQRGDSPAIDAIRYYLEAEHKQITIVDGPVYYDVDTFNYCEQEGLLLLSFESWNDVHPSFVSKRVNWDFYTPYGLLCPRQLTKNVTMFLEAIGTILNEQGINPSEIGLTPSS